MMSRTVMIMAGGTGGHVMPGLAVAQMMRERAWNVVWLGNPNGMEASLVPKHGIPMRWVQFGGLRGKGLVTKLLLPLTLSRAFWQSLKAIRATRPNVVLGLGGYISFPGGMMASMSGRPLVLHEQNSVAGLANKVLARVADRVLTAFPNALQSAEWCGNPVRPEILAVASPSERFANRSGPLKVLVVGGSLGAQALNQAVPKALAMLPPSSRPEVTHQSGKANAQSLTDAYREAGVSATLLDFIDDMASAYADADLVICRAGAMTVSELAAVGVASLLVPFPFAVDDHQTTNARFLSDQQAAILLPQSDLTPDRLAGLLQDMNREKLLAMALQARLLAKPDAARRVADVCEEVAR
jgi:UDP-N-acetylglucosamine--N-acetylmuramyl-(pentapeptide) pyrophosphoryl-undecaprenol N-acetylglucosamine transferase